MNEAQQVKARAKALREERAALQAELERAQGQAARAIRLELARIGEDLVDCSRQLRELMPQHKISRGRTWSGLEGWQWDKLQYQTWTELEGVEDPPAVNTEQDRMRLAVRAARSGISPIQEAYLTGTDGGVRPAQVARKEGKARSTVCRTLKRGQRRIEADAKAIYQLLGRQEGGPMVVDLGEPEVLKAVLDRLTQRQQTYLYLYYGEWLSLREIGTLLGVDHASVLRSIRCGLKRLESLALGEQVEVRGLDQLEERLMAHFNDLPPEEEPREKLTYRKRSKPTQKPAPIHLKKLLLRFVRGGQVRTAGAGGPELEVKPEGWSSGKLLAWLDGQGGGRRKRASWIRRLLYYLFAWIRRDLDVDHH